MNFGWRVVVTLRSKGKTSLKNMVDAAAQEAGRHKRVLLEATNWRPAALGSRCPAEVTRLEDGCQRLPVISCSERPAGTSGEVVRNVRRLALALHFLARPSIVPDVDRVEAAGARSHCGEEELGRNARQNGQLAMILWALRVSTSSSCSTKNSVHPHRNDMVLSQKTMAPVDTIRWWEDLFE